ncbi:hypothetical protein UCREL1_2184 [Eutypa lata UCREL1]|uniref:Uncharacterized protein n=1 Tax=Eutypa lata (strain UCR-EL1) TaxID=1287681 RepID=M7SVZ3_EUTLA|nr:hypothetical protein UCREL1_2184 [Eutypa lata UCREL1]
MTYGTKLRAFLSVGQTAISEAWTILKSPTPSSPSKPQEPQAKPRPTETERISKFDKIINSNILRQKKPTTTKDTKGKGPAVIIHSRSSSPLRTPSPSPSPSSPLLPFPPLTKPIPVPLVSPAREFRDALQDGMLRWRIQEILGTRHGGGCNESELSWNYHEKADAFSVFVRTFGYRGPEIDAALDGAVDEFLPPEIAARTVVFWEAFQPGDKKILRKRRLDRGSLTKARADTY